MITLNKIRELVLSQEQELEKLIFEYFLQKDITNYHNSSFNKNDKKNEIKLSIEDMISQGNLEKAKELLYKYKVPFLFYLIKKVFLKRNIHYFFIKFLLISY